jgi:hypothetical protein
VRHFLVRLLTSQRGIPQDQVRAVVGKWTVGIGQELRIYSAAMYLELFGLEDGWVIYHQVKLYVHREKCRESSKARTRCFAGAFTSDTPVHTRASLT